MVTSLAQIKWIQTTAKPAEWDIIGTENAGNLKTGCRFVLATLAGYFVQMGAFLHRLLPSPRRTSIEADGAL
ncbi:hypothetical protein VNO77_39585 [Canavalia gladiata]|uniref:Uncharacterized protein n=1 Tax=Canavalia gladiata TaxID=3824 RepID=A0AAN9JXJ0_CANGL